MPDRAKLFAGAEVVELFHQMMIEGIAAVFRFFGPDDELDIVLQACAVKIGHSVVLEPCDRVQHPETQILHDRADAENVVIRARYPDGRNILHDTLAAGQPLPGERVVFGKTAELIPAVIHPVDFCQVGPPQIIFELQIVRRVGKHQINALLWQRRQDFQRVAVSDLVE